MGAFQCLKGGDAGAKFKGKTIFVALQQKEGDF